MLNGARWPDEAFAGAACEKVFEGLLDGAPLTGRNSKWITFATWRHRICGAQLALLGDAARTARFSIGRGAKLAMEEGLALACVSEHADPPTLAAYEAERLPVELSTQRAAQASLDWFEDIGHGRQRHTRHRRWRPDV